MQIRFITAVAATALLTAPSVAKDDPSPSSLIAGLEKCLAIASDSERLACTDIAARRLVDASRRKDVVVVDREDMKKTRRSLFGFSLPRIGLFGKSGPDDAEEVDRVEVKVTRVASLGYGKLGFTIEGGARWNTTEAWVGRSTPNAGATLVIKRGALGSYMLSEKGGPSTRAMRVG